MHTGPISLRTAPDTATALEVAGGDRFHQINSPLYSKVEKTGLRRAAEVFDSGQFYTDSLYLIGAKL